jgi:hypothetical protein
MSLPAVLHVMSPLGGGVDRYVRDIVAAVPRPQVLWHVADGAEVMERRASGATGRSIQRSWIAIPKASRAGCAAATSASFTCTP